MYILLFGNEISGFIPDFLDQYEIINIWCRQADFNPQKDKKRLNILFNSYTAF